jgi:hypothetical protein
LLSIISTGHDVLLFQKSSEHSLPVRLSKFKPSFFFELELHSTRFN